MHTGPMKFMLTRTSGDLCTEDPRGPTTPIGNGFHQKAHETHDWSAIKPPQKVAKNRGYWGVTQARKCRVSLATQKTGSQINNVRRDNEPQLHLISWGGSRYQKLQLTLRSMHPQAKVQ